MPDPITPTRIIPAGQPLPPTAPSMPPAQPGATALPPWRQPPPPAQPPATALPSPPPPPSGPIEVRVVVDLVHPEPESEPESEAGFWARLWDLVEPHVRPVQTFLGGALALVPTPTGYSAATTWAYAVHEARDFGIPVAYGLGLGALAIAVTAELRARQASALRQLAARTAVVITFIGVIGAIDLYDPVTALTGVHR
ncbi:hypothetical protein [Streptomyces sp. AV19]|uniref:hypothetical protein n=1 Tax=Streptomyces sp. AV19 TaxID=2793068 RepID=UPI0024135646|nr:hypothetical protein [Streptomyces sp. AV19]MDG4531631.1 hypothetical protein [Streptomyces sp. AV19]